MSRAEEMVKDMVPHEELYALRWRTFIGLLVALIIVAVVALSWVALVSYQLKLVAQEVDEAAITCMPSITEDSAGHLQMVYATAAGLMYASEDDGAWSIEPIIESADYDGVPSFYAVALGIDGDGSAHVVSVSYWSDYANQTWISKLMHSWNTASGWDSEVLCHGAYGRGVSLAIDSNSNLHIAYAAPSDRWYGANNLTYATDVSGEWLFYDLTSEMDWPWFDPSGGPCIAVDGEDKPHIAFREDHMIGYVTNLTGMPAFQIISWGNPAYPSLGIEPSWPSILVTADDVVHVLCFSERMDDDMDEYLASVTHFMVENGVCSFDNRTIVSDTDFSYAFTHAIQEDDGTVCLFYASADEVGLARLTGDDEASIEVLHPFEERRGRNPYDLSVVLRDNGEMVVSKPYGSVGYLTDSYPLSERLYVATAPVQQPLITLLIVAVLLSIALLFSMRSLAEEKK